VRVRANWLLIPKYNDAVEAFRKKAFSTAAHSAKDETYCHWTIRSSNNAPCCSRSKAQMRRHRWISSPSGRIPPGYRLVFAAPPWPSITSRQAAHRIQLARREFLRPRGQFLFIGPFENGCPFRVRPPRYGQIQQIQQVRRVSCEMTWVDPAVMARGSPPRSGAGTGSSPFSISSTTSKGGGSG